LSYAPVWHQSSTSRRAYPSRGGTPFRTVRHRQPFGHRTPILHLSIRQKRGYMGRHVERGSRPTPTPASARAAGKKFPSSSKLLAQTPPQTRFPTTGFHGRPVGTDRGRGVGRSDASHQVAGGPVRPQSRFPAPFLLPLTRPGSDSPAPWGRPPCRRTPSGIPAYWKPRHWRGIWPANADPRWRAAVAPPAAPRCTSSGRSR